MSSELKIKIGGSLEEDGAAFIEAWRRAERGERVSDHQIAFESWEALTAVMTGKRLELLRYLHRHPSASIAELARALARDYKRVHEDVTALEAAGLIERDENGLKAEYSEIAATIAL
jgi:predicted transcriptional regulator